MILSVDIGTTSLKGGVFSDDGSLSFFYRLVLPRVGKEGFDPEWWLKGLVELLGEYERSGAGLSTVEGIVLSGHGPTLVALDGRGESLGPALMWYQSGKGSVRGSSLYLPLVEWFRRTKPEAYSRTECFLGCSEYILYRLTGARQTVSSGIPFNDYIWTEDSLAENGFESKKFPGYHYLGDKSTAFLSREGADLTGLAEGIPVYSGGSDFFTSLLGAGAVEPGVVCDRAGTSEGLNLIVPAGRNHDHIRFLPHPSAREGLWNGSIILSSTGALFEWYRRLTGQDDWPYRRTMEGITAADKNRLPDFFPSLNDGGLWEFSGGLLLGLEPEMDRFGLGRSVLEAIGYALKRGLSVLEAEGGPAKRIVTVGGQAKSPLWNRMKADMLNRKIEVPRIADAELLGGVVIFLTGEGGFPSLREGSKALYRAEEVIEPEDPTFYKEKFSRYKELSDGIKGFYGAYGKLI